MKRLLPLIAFLITTAVRSPVHAQEIPPVFEGLMQINGTELYLNVMGEGEPLVVVHGGPGLNHLYFLPHLEPLADDFRLILYDQRASGQSSVRLDSAGMSLDRFIGDIEGIRDTLGYDRIHLLGHSWGGFLAMQYALRYPDKTGSLILSNSAPASSRYFPQLMKISNKVTTGQDSLDRAAIMQSAAFRNREISAFEELMRISFRHSFQDAGNMEKLVIDLGPNYLKGSALLQHLSSEITSYNLYPRLASLDVPVLIIHGRADLMPIDAYRTLHTTLPDSRLMIYERSGHFPFIEEPERFREVVTRFLNSH